MTRSNGEGSIYKRKDGRWCGQVTVGQDPKTGKLKRKYIYGDTRKEVARKMTELLHKVNRGTYIKPSNMTVKEWLDKWLKGRKPHLAENSWRTYEMMKRCHIVPILGNVKLKDLTTRQIQDLINEKMVNGRIKGEGGLSPRTVIYIYTTLHAALNQAVKEKILPYNVAEPVEVPKQKKKEIKPYDKDQVNKLLNTAKNTFYYTPLFLELSTGLRRGELIGLKWRDLNFENQILFIKRQLIRTQEDGLIFKDPKTEDSVREIKLNDKVIAELKSHKIKQNENKLYMGEKYQDHNLLFCQENGKPLNPRNFMKGFKDIIKKAGLPDIRFHDLRHGFATLSLENGVPAKTIQDILGHSTISTTLDTYSHVTEEMQEDAANIIGQILLPDKKISP